MIDPNTLLFLCQILKIFFYICMTNEKTTDHLQIYTELSVHVVCLRELVCVCLLSFLSSLLIWGYLTPFAKLNP